MAHEKDRSRKRKAKVEARRKAARVKAARPLAKQGPGPELLVVESELHETYVTRPGSELVPPEGARGWPVVCAYAPVPDVWTATGLGTAGIVRQRPDGKLLEVTFTLNARDGLDAAFGKADVGSPPELLLERSEIADNLPPFEPAAPERAAEMIRGAAVLSRHRGVEFPELARYLAAVPRVAGDERALRDRLVGPRGCTPRELVELLRSLPDEGYTESMEPAVFTAVTFRAEGSAAIVDKLAAMEPHLTLAERDREDFVFQWTRPYPKGHWSPLAPLGGRQVLGRVKVVGGELVAETSTLSGAAKLLGMLKKALGSSIRLKAVTWLNPVENRERKLELP